MNYSRNKSIPDERILDGTQGSSLAKIKETENNKEEKCV